MSATVQNGNPVAPKADTANQDLANDASMLVEPTTTYTNPTLRALAEAFPNHADDAPDDESE